MENIKRNKIKSIMILFLFSLSLLSIFSVDNDLKALDITLLNQNPDPVYAGDIFEISLAMENVGYGTLDDVYLEIENEYPFTIISENKIQLNKVFSSKDYTYIEKIKIKADSSAKEGDYQLRINEFRGNTKIKHDINISIVADKSIEILSIDKNSIKPGNIEEVTFKIKNVGSTELRNIQFSWSNPDDILLPVNGDNKVFIESLGLNEERELSFFISASSIAEADLYKIEINMAYESPKSSEIKEVNSNSGIYVGGETYFDIIFDEISDDEYIFTVANIGSNDAESVKVSIDENSKWKTSSKNSEMIGNLNRGDYTTISYVFSRNIGDLIFKIDYTDTSGKRVSLSKTMEIPYEINSNSSFNSRQFSGTQNSDSTFSQRRNPMGGLQSGISTAGTWIKYTGYTILAMIVLFICFRIYKKTLRKKKN